MNTINQPGRWRVGYWLYCSGIYIVCPYCQTRQRLFKVIVRYLRKETLI